MAPHLSPREIAAIDALLTQPVEGKQNQKLLYNSRFWVENRMLA
jgi:hypothetical protein